MNFLTTAFGMLDEDIAKDFEAIDENGDGLISKQESFMAFQALGIDRFTGGESIEEEEDPEPPSPWYVSSNFVNGKSDVMNHDQKEAIRLLVIRNINAINANVENWSYFVEVMSMDLKKEFGGAWNCFRVTWPAQSGLRTYWNLDFGFTIKNDYNSVTCWKRC